MPFEGFLITDLFNGQPGEAQPVKRTPPYSVNRDDFFFYFSEGACL